MKRVLLIDSSIDSQNEVSKAIGSRFILSLASSLAEAREQLARGDIDLVLLEAVLPDGEGSHWCADFKKQEKSQDTPVIFLTRQASLSDKVKAFNSGADDYLAKPFEPLELELRMEARLRDSVVHDQEAIVQKGDFLLSVPYQKAILKEGTGEKDLRLTPTEFRLLYFFIKHENNILSRDQLLSTVWSDDVHVLTRTIDKHISTLKKKLGARSHFIQSVHSRGYRFSMVKSALREAMNELPMSLASTT